MALLKLLQNGTSWDEAKGPQFVDEGTLAVSAVYAVQHYPNILICHQYTYVLQNGASSPIPNSTCWINL